MGSRVKRHDRDSRLRADSGRNPQSLPICLFDRHIITDNHGCRQLAKSWPRTRSTDWFKGGGDDAIALADALDRIMLDVPSRVALAWKWVLGWPNPFSKFAALPDRIAFVIAMDRDMLIAELRKLLPAELVEDVEVGGRVGKCRLDRPGATPGRGQIAAGQTKEFQPARWPGSIALGLRRFADSDVAAESTALSITPARPIRRQLATPTGDGLYPSCHPPGQRRQVEPPRLTPAAHRPSTRGRASRPFPGGGSRR